MVFNQVNLVVRDMDATVAFYRLVGLEVVDGGDWPPGSGNRHIEVQGANGFTLEFDSVGSAQTWLDRPPAPGGGGAVLGFGLESRDAVDQRVAVLTAAGHRVIQAPYDAFWGSRYAVVADPDGYPVGLMSPRDERRRSMPTARA